MSEAEERHKKAMHDHHEEVLQSLEIEKNNAVQTLQTRLSTNTQRYEDPSRNPLTLKP